MKYTLRGFDKIFLLSKPQKYSATSFYFVVFGPRPPN